MLLCPGGAGRPSDGWRWLVSTSGSGCVGKEGKVGECRGDEVRAGGEVCPGGESMMQVVLGVCGGEDGAVAGGSPVGSAPNAEFVGEGSERVVFRL